MTDLAAQVRPVATALQEIRAYLLALASVWDVPGDNT